MSNLLYEKESYCIRASLFEVWKHFGGAFKERIVDNAVAISLRKRGLSVDCQKRISIFFEGQKVGTYIPDQVIEEKILLELKAKPYLTLEDKKQFWYYLKGSEYKLGFLVNFGIKLEIVRRVYETARKNFQHDSA